MDAAPLNTSIIILCSEVGYTFGNGIVQMLSKICDVKKGYKTCLDGFFGTISHVSCSDTKTIHRKTSNKRPAISTKQQCFLLKLI